MLEISEDVLVADLERRLVAAYAHLSPGDIADAVLAAREYFEYSTIRDFVPLLVERRVRTQLARTAQRVSAGSPAASRRQS
ncbi:three-helix bundle dimerization domain-containing protein [Mycolicibacterium sp. lyk4-40-TYG-92]|jgi:hypothetical protein|uniref:three-helix bundle dimerization domain-containing protein n=1 Tax=Mycolicibacterium sp. lyk4-40-TYG-92 TaxID=3040295 RepID=UPI00255083EA|nr:hypothetical protein [Mycolicibacterium sp. lyk4-40-TYG-92]